MINIQPIKKGTGYSQVLYHTGGSPMHVDLQHDIGELGPCDPQVLQHSDDSAVCRWIGGLQVIDEGELGLGIHQCQSGFAIVRFGKL